MAPRDKAQRGRPKKAKAAPPPPPSPTPEPDLELGEAVLEINTNPGLAIPDGWDMYYFGNIRNPDLNMHPAALGYPGRESGFYDIVTGKSFVLCPLCNEKFMKMETQRNHKNCRDMR
jgi:hypothetical protein